MSINVINCDAIEWRFKAALYVNREEVFLMWQFHIRYNEIILEKWYDSISSKYSSLICLCQGLGKSALVRSHCESHIMILVHNFAQSTIRRAWLSARVAASHT